MVHRSLVGRLDDAGRFICINSKSIPQLGRYLRRVPTNVGLSDWQLTPTPSIFGDPDETSAPVLYSRAVFASNTTPLLAT